MCPPLRGKGALGSVLIAQTASEALPTAQEEKGAEVLALVACERQLGVVL